jgi:multidrug efflux system membrane fusion protein
MRVLVSNPDGALLPGLFARVRMPTTPKQPTTLVAQRAIGTDQSQKFVYVVGESNVAERRTITLGPVFEGQRIVRTGLVAGERVVVNGLQRVRPGSPVTPELEQAPGTSPATPAAAPAAAKSSDESR